MEKHLEVIWRSWFLVIFAMESEQAFLRVHTRLSGVLARLLTPKLRSGLEFVCLCNAVMLLGLLVVMHVNFVAQV